MAKRESIRLAIDADALQTEAAKVDFIDFSDFAVKRWDQASAIYRQPLKFAQVSQSLCKEMLTQAAKCSRMEKSDPIEKKASNPSDSSTREISQFLRRFSNVDDALVVQSLSFRRRVEQGSAPGTDGLGTTANKRMDCYAKDGIITGSIEVER